MSTAEVIGVVLGIASVTMLIVALILLQRVYQVVRRDSSPNSKE